MGRRYFEIQEDGIRVRTRKFLTSQEYKVPFENITLNRCHTTACSKQLLWLSLLFVVLAVVVLLHGLFSGSKDTVSAFLFYGILAIICIVLYFLSRERFIYYLAGEGMLLFYEDLPSNQSLGEFLDELESRHKKYMNSNYIPRRNEGESISNELARLLWLKERGALTEQEYEQLKVKLLADHNKSSTPIGFKEPL